MKNPYDCLLHAPSMNHIFWSAPPFIWFMSSP